MCSATKPGGRRVLLLARFSEQTRGPTDATREMQEAGALALPPLCPPTLGGHRWEVTRCKEANNSLLNPGFRKDPDPPQLTKAPVHLGPHLPRWFTPRRPPHPDPKQDSSPSCTPTGIPLASDGCWKQVWESRRQVEV